MPSYRKYELGGPEYGERYDEVERLIESGWKWADIENKGCVCPECNIKMNIVESVDTTIFQREKLYAHYECPECDFKIDTEQTYARRHQEDLAFDKFRSEVIRKLRGNKDDKYRDIEAILEKCIESGI